ncbi:MAG: hypothetical protein HGA67_02035 [Candidatus Yonathbacteria bacterium]|nr:hypothetical protein [Candidatus Yonathbacteria bacterium]
MSAIHPNDMEGNGLPLVTSQSSPRKGDAPEKEKIWLSRAIAEELERMGLKVQYPNPRSPEKLFGTYHIAPSSGSYGVIRIIQHSHRVDPLSGVFRHTYEDHSVSLFVGCKISCWGRLMKEIIESTPKPFAYLVKLEEVLEQIAKPLCCSWEDEHKCDWEGGRISWPYVETEEEKNRRFHTPETTPKEWASILATRLERFDSVFPRILKRELPNFFNEGYGAMLSVLNTQTEALVR